MKKVVNQSVLFFREWFDPAFEGNPYVRDLEEKAAVSGRKNQAKLFGFQLSRLALK